MNGKWGKLAQQIGALVILVGAFVTALTSWFEARTAKVQADRVGRVATDLARHPELDLIYEALQRRDDELQRLAEWQQRRIDRLTERLDWLSRWSGEGPLLSPGTSEAPPEARAVPRKPGRIPEVKKVREKRAEMIEQMQEHLTK